MAGPHLSRDTKTRIVHALKNMTGPYGGALPNAVAVSVAAVYGVSPRTIRRIWTSRDTAHGPKRAVTLSVDDKVAIAAAHGNLKQAWRKRRAEGLDVGYGAFRQRFLAMSLTERVALTEGARLGAQTGLFAKQIVAHRNLRWHYDHTVADTRVVYRNKLGRPHISLSLDGHTRFILSAVATFGDGTRGDPGTEQIIGLLSGGMLGVTGPDGELYGGIPASVVFDNALAHTAQPVTNGLVMLGVHAYAIPKASPWRQGKVERAVQSVTTEFLSDMPGYVHGLQTRYGKTPSEAGAIPWATFVHAFDDYVTYWNFERPHQGINGLTPAEKWQADRSQRVEFADPDELRQWFMGDGKVRKVNSLGVMVDNVYYTDPKLNPYAGAKVNARWLPSNRSIIHVYTLDNEFICEARPHESLTAEQRAALSNYRENIAGRVTSYIKEGAERRRERAQEDADCEAIMNPDAAEDDEDDEFIEFLQGRLDEDGGQ